MNGLFNASDLRPETLKPYLSDLGGLLKRIKEQKALVEKYYAEGLTTTNNVTVSEAYRDIKIKLDGLKAFIEGNSDYNAVIAGDNLTRYNTFCAKVQETENKYGEGTAQIAGYQNVSTEELKELVNVESIIAAQENIYKYAALIKNLKDDAAATYAKTTSPALWDIDEANAAKAMEYTAQIEAYKKDLDLAVNTAVRASWRRCWPTSTTTSSLPPRKRWLASTRTYATTPLRTYRSSTTESVPTITRSRSCS